MYAFGISGNLNDINGMIDLVLEANHVQTRGNLASFGYSFHG
jgi:hypothetical protein